VGLLQRPDTEPHRFIREYTVEPFPLSGRHDDRSAAFRFEPVLCGGYAVRLTKTVRVYGERLSVAYELMNVGTRRICTREYNHNFLAPAGTGAGPDLELRLSPGLQLVRFGGGLEQTGALVRWAGIPAKSYMAVSRERLRHRTAGPVWELRHRVAGIGVSESVDMPVEQFGVWFAPHAVSPEVFVEIDIRPGQSAAWTREWRFFEC
jgi:hypothetical protein